MTPDPLVGECADREAETEIHSQITQMDADSAKQE